MGIAKYLAVTVTVDVAWVNPDLSSDQYPDGVLAPVTKQPVTVLLPVDAVARDTYSYMARLIETEAYEALTRGAANSALHLALTDVAGKAVDILSELEGPSGPITGDDIGGY